MKTTIFKLNKLSQLALTTSSSLILLVGCTAVGPNYKSPEANLPSNYRWEAKKNGRSAAQRNEWWKLFNDSGLNKLIAQVRNNNHDLKAGVKRIDQARAVIGITRSDALPQVSSSPSISRQRISDESYFGGSTYSSHSLPLSAQWETDLFGKIRRGVQAANADLQAKQEDLGALLLALETEAASRYFNLRALDAEIKIVSEGVKTRQDSLNLAKNRHAGGVASELDVAQAATLLATSQADLAGLKRQRSAQEASIAVIAGTPASTFNIPTSPLTSSPPRIPTGIPSELLRARPDIRSAERTIAAENARVGVATAAFYPSISLTGNLGFQAADIAKTFNHGARFWAINPSIYIPIFQGGRNKAKLAQSKARYQETLENYQQTILEALAEVETSLAARKFYANQSAALNRAADAASKARQIATAQYEGGTSDYLNVLDAERSTLNAKRQQAVIRGADYVNTISLIRAIGGRW